MSLFGLTEPVDFFFKIMNFGSSLLASANRQEIIRWI